MYVFGIEPRRPPILRMSCSPARWWMIDAGGEEEQRLEEGVRHQVEHRAAVGAEPGAEEHVADLRHRRVRDHALDVGLDERDEAGDEQRDRAEPGGEVGDRRRQLEDRVRADDQVDAGRDHRRGVDQRRDRRRALHRVGEPRVERDLGRLGDGAAEQPERDEVDGGLREARGARRTPPRSSASRSATSGRRTRAPSSRRRRRSSRRPSSRPRPPPAAGARSRSGGRRRARRGPSRRAGGGSSPPARAAASRRRTATCRRSSAAPRDRRPCSRSSRGRSGRRRRRRSASSSPRAGRRAARGRP